MTGPITRPTHLAESVLLANVARRFYLVGQSKTEIADDLEISRFRVARLLETARETGLVRIEITTPGQLDSELSWRLQQTYGLAHALVLDIGVDDEPAARRTLGEAAADLLSDIVTVDDVVGLAWARSLHPMGTALDHFLPVPVVQLTGALSRPDGLDVLELVRTLARLGGGAAHVFYAPMIAADAGTARTLRRQPDVTRVLRLARDVTVAAVGIGAWEEGLSTVYDAFSPDDREALARAGVVADVSGVLLDAGGDPVENAMTQRVVGFTAADLQAIPTVIAVAYGDAKATAVASALRGGHVNALVTHSSMAEALLSLRESPDPDGPAPHRRRRRAP
ncbi:sugar-binding transcriptional regulator [Jatrophihabitans sp. YIM 134969]